MIQYIRQIGLFKLLTVLITFVAVAITFEVSANNYNNTSSNSNRQYRHQELYGQIVHISDGDTLTLQTNQGQKLKIRLYAIDAPEKAQPYGPQATGILRNLVGNMFVMVYVEDVDRYGRIVGRVFYDRQDINAEMIRLGAAWHYKFYDKSGEYQRYADLEEYARNNRKGLWNRDNPLPPWEYRKAVREQKQYRSY